MKKLLIIGCLLNSLAVKADFNSALDLYNAGDFTQAHKEFLSMAEVGEKRSQFNLGVMYYYGQSVEQDLNKSYAWMKLAIDSETSSEREAAIFNTVESKIKDKNLAELEYKNLNDKYSTAVLLQNLYPVLVKPENGNGFNAIPEKIVEPKYPKKALYKGLQGWTRFKFDIDSSGTPRNIQLVESFPDDIFVSSSIKAIKKWKFKAPLNDAGAAIGQENLNYTMQYKLYGAENTKIKEDVYQQTTEKALQGDASAQFNIGFWDKKLGSPDKTNPNEWFLKSAMQGHPSAQFELGQSLVYGRGCLVDKSKGIEWLTRSAVSGQVEAKSLLGALAMKLNDLDSQKRAIEYLSDVKELPASTQLSYAWMLVTSPFVEVANPLKAIELSHSLDKSKFSDDATLYEIRAAAYAALGDFKKAVDLQEDALDEAEDMDADLSDIKSHLIAYKQNKKWF